LVDFRAEREYASKALMMMAMDWQALLFFPELHRTHFAP
jgi:hypothetical protein